MSASKVVRCVRTAALMGERTDLSDGQLLEAFVRFREPGAIEALARRHGPMVWGVCRRILRNHHDAEDAYQATFLVLVRKAASVTPRDMVGNWLYGVARRTALKARATKAVRKTRETQPAEMPEPVTAAEGSRDDPGPLLDQELGRLPDKYRVVIVLCDLEGKTRPEVATRLGCPEGTVGSRLARARAMLAKRLARRGVAVPAGTLAAVLSPNAVPAGAPASIMAARLEAGSGDLSHEVNALAEGVLRAMWLKKLKGLAVLLAVTAVAVTAVGAVSIPRRTGSAPSEARPFSPAVEWEPGTPTPKAERKLAPVVQAGHTMMINAASFSPDGKWIVTASEDTTAAVWETATGRKVRTLPGHTLGAPSATFSPDGRRILTTCPYGAFLWDSATGKCLQIYLRHLTGGLVSATFSPDGKRVVTASAGKTAIIWNSDTGEQLRTLEGHADGVIAAAFSPDGKRVVTASADKTAIIWDAVNGKKLRILEGHTDKVQTACFSPNGRRVVTASRDQTAIVWDGATGEKLIPLTGVAESASYSPDGRHIVTASQLWLEVAVHDADTGKRLDTMASRPLSNQVFAVRDVRYGSVSAYYSQDSKQILALNGFGDAAVYEVATGKKLRTISTQPTILGSASYRPDGKRIITACTGATAIVWDGDTGRQLAPIPSAVVGASHYYSSICYRPDGAQFVTTEMGAMRTWNAGDGRKLREFPDNALFGASYSPDGKQLIAATRGKAVIIWSAASGEKLRTLEGHTDRVSPTNYSPDGKRIVTASDDNTAVVWDTSTGEKLRTLEGHTEELTDANFSPDGAKIVTASRDRTAIIWDATTGKKLRVLEGHWTDLLAASFSPDGKTILTTPWYAPVTVWDVATGAKLYILQTRSTGVRSANYSPDGATIITASWDGVLGLWDAGTGREICSLVSIDSGKDWLVVTPEGLYDGSPGGRAKIAFRIDGESEVIPADRVTPGYYRPGLLADIWKGKRPVPE